MNYHSLCSLLTRPFVLLAVIVSVIGITSFSTYQKVFTTHPQKPETVIISSEETSKTSLSTEEIVSIDLFGTTVLPNAAKQKHEEIPETKLKLILKGAFTNTDANMASAIIAKDKTKGATLYLVGDELPGNAILKEVHPHFVIIKRGIQLEKIVFSRNLSGAVSNNEGNGTKIPTYTLESQTAPTASQDNMSAGSTTAPNTASPKSLHEIREQIRNRNE